MEQAEPETPIDCRKTIGRLPRDRGNTEWVPKKNAINTIEHLYLATDNGQQTTKKTAPVKNMPGAVFLNKPTDLSAEASAKADCPCISLAGFSGRSRSAAILFHRRQGEGGG
ncbi:MAG: hypothetical protein DI535_18065 [Citrobacter freundii]|nr:MAG: hypothetical protein DI535_18065 [Citrobacter freundii]